MTPDQATIDQATRILCRTGVRLIRLGGVSTVGLWSDLDGPIVRRALQVLGLGGLPVRFLDGDGIPPRYRLRRVPGEPVSLSRLREMEQAEALRELQSRAIAPGGSRKVHPTRETSRIEWRPVSASGMNG